MATTVAWATSKETADTATPGTDYTAGSGTLSFAKGDTSKTVTVTVTGDEVDEANETLTVTLSAASDGSVHRRRDGDGDDHDDDDRGLVFSPTSVTVTEASGTGRTATYTVALSSQPTGAVSVAVATADSTAATVLPATVSFTTSNWKTGQTVTVTGVDDSPRQHAGPDDGDRAHGERGRLRLGDRQGAGDGDRRRGHVVVLHR